MTKKEIMIDFIGKKSKIIKKITGLKLAHKADIKDLEENWTEAEAARFLEGLDPDGSDGSACPWCDKYRRHGGGWCEECTFGKRRGICCENSESLYDRVTTKLGGGILYNDEIIKSVTATVAKSKQ